MRDSKTFYFNIGENYTILKDSEKTIDELRKELREKLATLKWTIMETQPKLDRSEITDNYLQKFQDEIVGRCNYGYGFSLTDAIAESYHDKNITTPEEVFSFLENIEIGTHNAFLMKDKTEYVLTRKR